MLRLLAIPAILLAFAAPAQALDRPSPSPTTLGETVTTLHFVIHYTTTGADQIKGIGAQTLAANAERAYAIETGWGWPPPKDDGDGRTDIYVFNSYGATYVDPDQPGSASSTAYIVMYPMWVVDATTIAHEFFHVLQMGVDAGASSWLMESTAHWAEHEINPQMNVNEGFYFHYPEESLDCYLATCGTPVGDRGYNRWMFWSFLVDRYGPAIVQETFESARAGHDAIPPRYPSTAEEIDAVLARHGSSLARAYADFAVANLLRSYRALDPLPERVPQRGLVFGSVRTVTLAHLATTYLALQRPSKACTTTRLHIRVAPLPLAGSVTLVIDKAVVGSGASIDATWKTCKQATLVVSNTSLSDGQPFTIQSSAG